MEKVKAFIERGADGTYGVYVDLKDTRLNYGVHGDGSSVKEAVADFLNSYNEMKNHHQLIGKEFNEAEFEFVYDTASFLEYYSKIISLAGLERLTGINQRQLSHYLTGHRKPSKRTVEKIEEKLHRFGEELIHLEFT